LAFIRGALAESAEVCLALRLSARQLWLLF